MGLFMFTLVGEVNVLIWFKLILLILLFYLPTGTSLANDSLSVEEQELNSFLARLFDARTQLFIHQDKNGLADFYNPSVETSKRTFLQELKRSRYLNAWARARGIIFTDAEGRIYLKSIQINGDTAQVSLFHSTRLAYLYDFKNYPRQQFGAGTRHKIFLKKENDQWYVLRDTYSDPMEENPDMIPITSVKPYMDRLSEEGRQSPVFASPVQAPVRYHRRQAVAYANKYAGSAWGAGNRNEYNERYKDYTDEGGDCTNFASQVIGDPIEGGGLPMMQDWYFSPKSGGTISWIRTDSFKDFLLYGGYGQLIASGYFDEVTKPIPSFPKGAIQELKPGDLIGYEIEGDLDHFSIVVGTDDHGYLLVNSHTGDRYRMPWDIGWDKNTKFWLIHIKD